MNKSFLDYYKYVLEKVSFDPHLFIKEYKKAKRVLEKHEEKQLLDWIKERGLNADLVPIRLKRQI